MFTMFLRVLDLFIYLTTRIKLLFWTLIQFIFAHHGVSTAMLLLLLFFLLCHHLSTTSLQNYLFCSRSSSRRRPPLKRFIDKTRFSQDWLACQQQQEMETGRKRRAIVESSQDASSPSGLDGKWQHSRRRRQLCSNCRCCCSSAVVSCLAP